MMKQDSTDRRVLRTKRLLRNVLREAVDEKGLEGVTVSDLTERAGINRGTFYAHYHDKNDMVRSIEDEIIHEITELGEGLGQIDLEELFRVHDENAPLAFAVALYDYLRDNGLFVRSLIGPNGDPSFRPRFQQAVMSELVGDILHPRYLINMTPLTKYYIAYHTGAQLGIIQQWFDTGMRESSEEMARIAVGIMFMAPGDAIEMPGYTVPGHSIAYTPESGGAKKTEAIG